MWYLDGIFSISFNTAYPCVAKFSASGDGENGLSSRETDAWLQGADF